MKQEQGKSHTNSYLEEIDGVDSEGVYEIVPMRDPDEVHGCLAEDQSVDSTSNVLGSILMSMNLSNKVKSSKLKDHDISRAYFQKNHGETRLHLDRSGVSNTTPNFERRM